MIYFIYRINQFTILFVFKEYIPLKVGIIENSEGKKLRKKSQGEEITFSRGIHPAKISGSTAEESKEKKGWRGQHRTLARKSARENKGYARCFMQFRSSFSNAWRMFNREILNSPKMEKEEIQVDLF